MSRVGEAEVLCAIAAAYEKLSVYLPQSGSFPPAVGANDLKSAMLTFMGYLIKEMDTAGQPQGFHAWSTPVSLYVPGARSQSVEMAADTDAAMDALSGSPE